MVLKAAQFLRNLHREEEGFTLIELLIVIAIIAVIAAIAIPMVASRIDDARESADRANVPRSRVWWIILHRLWGIPKWMPVKQGWSIWMEELVEKDYLHETVVSPYPGVTEDGYTLEVRREINRDALSVRWNPQSRIGGRKQRKRNALSLAPDSHPDVFSEQ